MKARTSSVTTEATMQARLMMRNTSSYIINFLGHSGLSSCNLARGTSSSLSETVGKPCFFVWALVIRERLAQGTIRKPSNCLFFPREGGGDRLHHPFATFQSHV